jgi:hypothetical protein
MMVKKPDSGNVRRNSVNIQRDSENIWSDDDDKPVGPTWAVGALFKGARCVHINRVCFQYNTIQYNAV